MIELHKRADFYLLPTTAAESMNHFACRLTEKVANLGKRIYFLCRDEEQQTQLDDLLYSFRPDSFLPHSTKDQVNELTLITLGLALPVNFQPEVLINFHSEPALQLPLSSHPTTKYRVVELVMNTVVEKDIARLKFKGYKDAGFEMQTHNLDAA